MAQQVAVHRELERAVPDLRGAERSVRAEVARELHDRVTEPLTSMLLEMEEFKRAPGDRRARLQRIGRFQGQARQALDGIREVLCELREQDWLDHAFPARLRGELEAWKRRHRHVDVRLEVSPRWPSAIRARNGDHLLHIVLEACGNARAHGGAARIDVALRWPAGGPAELCVDDDGRGV